MNITTGTTGSVFFKLIKMNNNTQILDLLQRHKVWIRGTHKGRSIGGRIESHGLHKVFPSWGYCITIQRCVVQNIDLDELVLRVQKENNTQTISLEEWLNQLTQG